MRVPPPPGKDSDPCVVWKVLKHSGTGTTGSRHVLLKFAQIVATQERLQVKRYKT